MKKRMLASLLALVIVLAVALSAAATVLEATHDCSGGDCGICGILKAILIITQTVSLSVCLIVIGAVCSAPISFSKIYDHFLIYYSNPVSQKVRLLN